MGIYDGEEGLVMKKYLFLLYLLFALCIDVETSFGQENQYRYVELCMGAYFDLVKLKMDYQNRLNKVEEDIKINEQHIIEINKLLAEIQKTINYGTEQERKKATLAEPVAQDALRTAKEKRRSLSQQRIELQMQLDRLSQEEKNISDLCKALASTKSGGVLRNCSGDVRIISEGSKESSCSMHSIIREGDVITTGADGKATFYLLNGRGRVYLEPNTTVSILKDTKDEQIIEFTKGKAEIDIKKHKTFVEESKNIIDSFIEKFPDLMKSVKEWFTIDEKEKRSIKLWMCKKGLTAYFKCAMPHAVIGVRGTNFEIDRTVDDEVKIYVKEGAVDLNVSEGQISKNMILEAGYEALLNLENNTVSTWKR